MKTTNQKHANFLYVAFFVLLAALLGTSLNASADVDTDDFIEEASAKGMGEVEAAKVALQKATHSDVKDFARKMIEDHTAANKDLRALASKKNVELADDPELMAQAKTAILKQRDGESFDAAYVNNQIDAHKAALELYREAAESKDTDVRQLAVASIPKLEKHLAKAEALVPVLAGSSANIKMDDDGKADHH